MEAILTSEFLILIFAFCNIFGLNLKNYRFYFIFLICVMFWLKKNLSGFYYTFLYQIIYI